MLGSIAKILLVLSAVLLAAGGVLYALTRMGISRVPGDLEWGGKNWRVYLPIGTSILISILLTLLLYVISRLKK